jgi:hypothetical protein
VTAGTTEKVIIDPSTMSDGDSIRMYISGCVTEEIIPKNNYTGQLALTKGSAQERSDYLGASSQTIDEIIEDHKCGQNIVRIEAKDGQNIYGVGCTMGNIDVWDTTLAASQAYEWFSVFDRAGRIYAGDGVLTFQKVGTRLYLVAHETFEFYPVYKASDRYESSSNFLTLNAYRNGVGISVVLSATAIIIPRYFYSQRTQWIVANSVTAD